MKEGIVKFFNVEKGFGFITPVEGGEDIFVHKSGLKQRINQGDKVNYNVEKGKKGLNAVDVVLA